MLNYRLTCSNITSYSFCLLFKKKNIDNKNNNMSTIKLSSSIKVTGNDNESSNIFAVDITLDSNASTSSVLIEKENSSECMSVIERSNRPSPANLTNENVPKMASTPPIDSSARSKSTNTSIVSSKRNEMHFFDMNFYKELYVKNGISIFEIFPSTKNYKPNSYLNAFACLPNNQSYYYCQIVEDGGRCCAYKYKSTEFKRPFRKRNDALNKHFARHHLKDAKDETLYSNLNEYQASKLLEKSKILQSFLLSRENLRNNK